MCSLPGSARTVVVGCDVTSVSIYEKLSQPGFMALKTEGIKKREKRKHLLFLCDAVAAHALTRIIDLVQDILGGDVSGANDADSDGNGRPIVAQPASCGREHG